MSTTSSQVRATRLQIALSTAIMALVFGLFVLPAALPAMLDGLGPDDITAEADSAAAHRDAQRTAERQSKFAKAAQRVCGGENATWKDLGDGIIECRTKHGRITARLSRQHMSEATQ